MNSSDTEPIDGEPALEPIAIVGLACRLPGARDIEQYWQNLADGVESIRFTSLEEQLERGVPEHEVRDPNFVPATAILDDYEYFDAAFFNMSAREAELRDPQHRLFLELAHTALEDSGYDPSRFPGEIGVYAGSGENGYEWHFTRRNRKVFESAGVLAVAINSHPDFMATLVSYKLNLRGPSLTVHTACSTSLVAIHLACEALRAGDCEMAVTGGVSIDMPPGRGYLYVEDGIYSADGHCRAFDANSSGTLWGNGGGVVVLKRLSDALADGDHIRALLIGNAINNDGATKVGFTAPSEEGQVAVIAHALGVAGIDGRSVTYVEAHGTGTSMGDPIEVAALSRAYGHDSDDTGWCALSSVKTNIGHLGHASGVAGVIKTALALENELIPPIVNFDSPNPAIDFAASPFYINTALSAWKANGRPRRAGVSSFGMGGTNGHLIMQEAPRTPRTRHDRRPTQLIQVSARTETALASAVQRLVRHLGEPKEPTAAPHDLADVAHTLRVGRRELAHRTAVVADSPADAAKALADPKRRSTGSVGAVPPRVALMFSGQGAQYVGMGTQLYRTEPVFAETVDECCTLLRDELGLDLREVLFAEDDPAAEERLRQTEIAQPALFVVCYALGVLWRSWGVRPDALVGHSIGEYAAATLAEVFTLPDALRVVAARGRLMQRMPTGAMLAVQLDEAQTRGRLPEGLSIATVNGPGSCVVSGAVDLVAAFAEGLTADEIGSRPLRTSHAFHSPMMEPVLAEFREVVASVGLRAPNLPVLSNVSGSWLTATEATDPSYWTGQLRQVVRFGDCLTTLLAEDRWLLVECGPGRQLCGLVRLQGKKDAATALPSLPHRGDRKSDLEVLQAAAGRLWVDGVGMDASFGSPGSRVPLPTYPWERKYFWVKPDADSDDFYRRMNERDAGPRELTDWFTVPVWRQQIPSAATLPVQRCLVLADRAADPLVDALAGAGAEVVVVRPGATFHSGEHGYTVRAGERDDYDALFAHLAEHGGVPGHIVHAWTLGLEPGADPDSVWRQQDLGFFGLLSLVQALAETQPEDEIRLDILTCGTQDVVGGELIRAEHATVAGIAKVVPLEMAWLVARQIDLDLAQGWPAATPAATAQLLTELRAEPGEQDTVALRRGRRWHRDYEPVAVAEDLGGLPAGPGLRERGIYLITGGLGGIGITLAEHLAAQVGARLVLLSRSELPPREEWDARMAVHGTADRTGRAIAAIRRMEDVGGEVLVLAADVTSEADLRAVRETVLDRFGHLDGIVHAAGLPGGGMTEVKERAAAEAVLAPKVLGTLALRAVFGDLESDFVVLCSSLYSIAGEFGQVDYCAGNAFMDAHARAGTGWRAPVVSANWGSWLDVGMSAEVSAPAAFRALQRGDKLISMKHPVLTRRYPGEGDNPGWCAGTLSPQTHWTLGDHRIAGVPVLPGTGQLEAVRRAVEEAYPAPSASHVIELRDVVFVEPMSVPDGGSAELRVVLSNGADGIEFQTVSLSGGARHTHAQGGAAWVDPGEPAVVDIEEIRARCTLATRERGDAFVSVTGLITFGPHWGNVRAVHEGAQEELAVLEATETTAADLDGWGMHPALLDEATAFGRSGDDRYLPLGYGRITMRAPLPARFFSHLRHVDTGSAEVVTRDLVLYDETGRELVSIGEFTLRHVDSEALAGALTTAAASALDGPGAGESLAEAGSGFGIRPADGAEAFRRLVCADLGGQVAVSVMPVDQVIASSKAFTHETVENELDATVAAAVPERTSADGYVAPRNELEAAVARIWGDGLGIAQVGVTDDFFEIGGDSLIAVQLLAMVRGELGVRLPMRSIFEEPTVAGVSARIDALRRARPAAEVAPVPTGPSVIPRRARPTPVTAG